MPNWYKLVAHLHSPNTGPVIIYNLFPIFAGNKSIKHMHIFTLSKTLKIHSHIIKMSNYIPIDIQVEIMKRLPIKSLREFRCVSKQWKSLIDGLFTSLRDSILERFRRWLQICFDHRWWYFYAKFGNVLIAWLLKYHIIYVMACYNMIDV